jgi:large subunit ribosomal protein L24
MQKAKKKQIRYTKAAQPTKDKKYNRILASQALVKKGRRNLKVKLHVNKGDEVVVISGDDKGKIAKVLEVYPKRGKILVEGVNIIKKHTKAQGPGQEGEIVERESVIFASKVMLWDDENKKASRVGMQITESGKKLRVFKTSGEQID